MRAELSEILARRYGEGILNKVVLIEPTDEDVENYERHNGRTYFQIDLSHDPYLVVVDTAKLILLRQSWINHRQPDSLTLVVSSGVDLAPKGFQVQTYDQRVEGLELTFHYSPSRREIPYSAELKPLW